MEKRIISMLLIVSMLCSLCACGKSASANEMKLVKTEGTAHVSDDKQQEQSIHENMNLYDGYLVGTAENSFAWMNLDFVKLLKLNESSNAVLEKDGRKLKVVLQSGDMFFCVLEELEKDESLTLETGNMSMAIRGTCGIVRVLSGRESQLVLLEGKVTVTDTAGMVRQDVETGQVLNLYVEDDRTANLTLREIRSDDILDFAREYIYEDTRIQDKIQSGGGTTAGILPSYEAGGLTEPTGAEAVEVYGSLLECYRKMLAGETSVSFDGGYVSFDDGHSESLFSYDASLVSVTSYNYANCPQYQGDAANGITAEDTAALQNWQYAFYDFNSDGFPELLIADSTLEDGYGIRTCWTTDGYQVMEVCNAMDNSTLRFTTNGYCEVYRPHTYGDTADGWTFYLIHPYPGVGYTYEASATCYYDTGKIWRCMITSGFENTVLLDTEDVSEFKAYIQGHYPLIVDTSFSWQPLN